VPCAVILGRLACVALCGQSAGLWRARVDVNAPSPARRLVAVHLSFPPFPSPPLPHGRPHCPIFCVTPDERVARRLQLCRGTHAVLVPPGTTVVDSRRTALAVAKKIGFARRGDRVVSVHGARSNPSSPGVQISMSHVV
jgi:hypothetical protein